jgi:hypothetical protein
MERKYLKYRKIIKISGLIVLCCIILRVSALLYNNVSLQNDNTFSVSLDKSIGEAIVWVSKNEYSILESPNIALLKMLDDCDKMHPTAEFSEMIKKFMLREARPKCWKALIDPNRPVDKAELNETIKQEDIDNQWTLYAISSGKADVTAEQLGMLDYDCWRGRQLTHQLWGLILLRERTADKTSLDKLIEHLCSRLANELYFNVAVVDIYIQRIAFVLKARHQEKIRRRWIERVIENQHNDGGWNDKWFCFGSRWRSSFRLHKPTDSHATIQALWLLYQVKYRYPEYFGFTREGEKQVNSENTRTK